MFRFDVFLFILGYNKNFCFQLKFSVRREEETESKKSGFKIEEIRKELRLIYGEKEREKEREKRIKEKDIEKE